MKKSSFLIAAILAISGIIQAQVSKGAFEKAVDFVNCKTVELSLQNDVTNLQKYIQSCPCGNSINYIQVKDFLNSAGNLGKTIAVSDEIESLKKIYKENLNTEEVSLFLAETIFKEERKYPKLFLFSEKRKTNQQFVTFKEDLKKNIVTILTPTVQTSTNNPNLDTASFPLTIEERINALEHGFKSNGESKGWFTRNINYFISIFLLLTMIAVIYLIIKQMKVKDKSKSAIGDIGSITATIIDDRRFSEQIQYELNKKIDIRDIVSKVVNEIKPEISKFVEQQSQAKPTMEWDVSPTEYNSSLGSKQPEIKLSSEIFFLSNPNSDGSFNESSASISYKEGASIYKFTKIGSNKAKFQIDERETSVKLALTYPDKSIDPVCEASNAFNPKAKRIVTDKQGEAELIGDKWEKTSKAKIRYES